MRVRVKICGLTTAGAVEAAVAAGADAIGLVFAESVRRVNPRQAADLCSAVPPMVMRVFVNSLSAPALSIERFPGEKEAKRRQAEVIDHMPEADDAKSKVIEVFRE